MRLKVTQAHIDAGLHSTTQCPIALALQGAGFAHAMVGYYSIMPQGNWRGDNFDHAGRVREFIREFDRGRPVEPHTFIIPQLTRPPQGDTHTTERASA